MKINKNKMFLGLNIFILFAILFELWLFFFPSFYPCANGCCQHYIELFYAYVLPLLGLVLIYGIIRRKKLVISKSIFILSIITILVYVCSFVTMVVVENYRMSHLVLYKPVIYMYPIKPSNVKVRLSRDDAVLYSYPKYDNGWDVLVNPDGMIYDSKTNRHYYALFWEGIDDDPINTQEGFIVSKNEVSTFLEEKLAILGLNEKESNEFIMFWLPKLEENPYNFIHFRTEDEIHNQLLIDQDVDTMIRVYMDYIPLNKKVNVSEQILQPKERNGFTVVEWGGRRLDESLKK